MDELYEHEYAESTEEESESEESDEELEEDSSPSETGDGDDDTIGEMTPGDGKGLNVISVFTMGQGNPSGFNSFAILPPSSEDEPLAAFAAGCSGIFQLFRTDARHDCHTWKPVPLPLEEGSHISCIAIVESPSSLQRDDNFWLLVASISNASTSTPKPHLTVVEFERTKLLSRTPRIMTTIDMDYYPLCMTSTAEGTFIVCGTDGVHGYAIHKFWSCQVTPLALSSSPPLRHLMDIRYAILCIATKTVSDAEVWAAGCQDGWVRLWLLKQSYTWKQTTGVLLNGPIASVEFFTVAEEKYKKFNMPDDPNPHPWNSVTNLLVAEAMGRVIVYWDIVKYGLSQPEVLPPPAAAPSSQTLLQSTCNPEDFNSTNFLVTPSRESNLSSPLVDHRGTLRSHDSPTQMQDASSHSAQLPSQDPSPSDPDNTEADEENPDSQPCHNPTEIELGEITSTNSTSCLPECSSPLRQPVRFTHTIFDAGVTCATAVDATANGWKEILVGTYSCALVTYTLAPRIPHPIIVHPSPTMILQEYPGSSPTLDVLSVGSEPGGATDVLRVGKGGGSSFWPLSTRKGSLGKTKRSDDDGLLGIDMDDDPKKTAAYTRPWGFVVQGVKHFSCVVRCISSWQPPVEVTRELLILTMYNLYVACPDVQSVQDRVRRRIALTTQIERLEAQLDTARSCTPLSPSSHEDDDEPASTSSSSSTPPSPPAWILERFAPQSA
eukprot:Sspe_Gene.58874::Locus_32327_Transcript_1_1_Confidence_1.000_Length_2487::g.58874::m.58874